MKKIIAYIAVLAAFTAVSCNRSEMDIQPMDSSMLSISLNVGDMAATRASAIPAVEDVVSQFDWFIYADATGTSAPVFHGHFKVGSSLTPSGTDTPNTYTADADGTIHLGFNLQEGKYTSLGASYYVYVLANYPGINHGTASELTLQKLLAKEVETNFDEKSEDYQAISNFVMDSYSKDDDADYPQLVPVSKAVADASDNTKARLAVQLRRVAAKITFTLNISAEIQDPQSETFWHPLTKSGNFVSYMVNALSYATMSGEAKDADTMAPTLITGDTHITGGHQISYATSHVKTAKDTHEPPLKWELDPFYTYPVSFETDSNNAPYLKIALPWENVDADNNLTDKGVTVYYYKVYLLDKATGAPLTSFDRNKHYIIQVNVDTIGGTQEDYVTLKTDFYIADWQQPEDGTYEGYRAPRFLDVARPVYYIYGDFDLNIAVTSSHNIGVEILGVSQTNIMGQTKMSSGEGWETWFEELLDDSNPFQPTVTPNGKESFDFHYEMDTTLDRSDREMDLTPITWHIRVYHEEDPSVSKNVDIVQYPSIYGERDRTQAWNSRYVNGECGMDAIAYDENGTPITENPTNSGKVDVWSNNHTSTSDPDGKHGNQYYPNSLGGVKVYANKSWYKTILTVSSLASLMGEGSTYNWVVGDPRVRLADSGLYDLNPPINGLNWLRNDLGDAPDFLDDYLVPDINKSNYIAPRFMICSGLAANAGSEKEHWKNAAERCAAYQEDGYPAGRWRLPTEAEIEFVILLEMNKYIDENKSNFNYQYYNHHYWTSSGTFYDYRWNSPTGTIEGATGVIHFTTPQSYAPYDSQYPGDYGPDGTRYPAGSTRVSDRCVYDLWYWGDEPYDNDGNKISAGSTAAPATQWLGYMPHLDD